MDIYLCSTVRHLLFSLLRSLSNEEQVSHIFFICDQQKIDKNNYDCTCLPENISISFIRREDIKKKLTGTITGSFVKTIAQFNIKTLSFLREKMRGFVFGNILELKNSATSLESAQLYLFNDRNKISRLFRLAFKDYSIIEDGLSNYSGKKFNFFEKIKALILFNKQNMRYLGDDKRCKEIYLLKPKDAPEYIKEKVKEIDFITAEVIDKYCYNFFKVEPLQKSYTYILATQPIAIEQFSNSGYDMLTYEKVISELNSKNVNVALKVHPREDLNKYKEKFPDIDLIESKIPLELVLFSNKTHSHIVSIYSTAGMGFEDFCNRITLINDREAENMNEILSDWKRDPKQIDVRIKEVIS